MYPDRVVALRCGQHEIWVYEIKIHEILAYLLRYWLTCVKQNELWSAKVEMDN